MENWLDITLLPELEAFLNLRYLYDKPDKLMHVRLEGMNHKERFVHLTDTNKISSIAVQVQIRCSYLVEPVWGSAVHLGN